MIYTENTIKAMSVAQDAHNKQYDKCGIPYIYHPIIVAEQMKDEKSTIVALLHDVVEDTDMSLEYLSGIFDTEIINAIDAITRRDNEKYFDYIKRVKQNNIARKVKIVDVKHNMQQDRFDLIQSDKSYLSLLERYSNALRILES